MIIREITTDTDKILKTFDWFNDYWDTRRWCDSCGHTDIVKKLDEQHLKWVKSL